MSLHLATQTSTYSLTLAGWQVAIVLAVVFGTVWAVRAWRSGVRPSDLFGKR